MGTEQTISHFPQWYETWLFSALAIENGDVCQEQYLKPLYSLNNHWLQENYAKEEYKWDSPEVATSYALYYMTANVPKLWMILDHSLEWRTNILPDITDITEFGCGPGTFLWSYLFYLYKNSPKSLSKIDSIRGYDHSQENLNVAQKLFDELKKLKEFSHIKAEFIYDEWQNSLADNCDPENENHLYIFGNSLIESAANIDLLENANFANLLILEPGTSKHFKRLKQLRDQLIKRGSTIYFPCPGHSSCPMTGDNWCHFFVNRFMLPFMQKISNAAGRKNHKHHFSAFLFGNKIKKESSSSWRLISGTRKAKGSAIRFLCNGERIREVVLNKKEKSETNRNFIKAPTGSLAQCSSTLKNNRLYSKDHFSH